MQVSEAVGTVEKKHKESVGEFIRKTRGELDKTTFPPSDEVKNTTIIVIVSVIFFGIYLFAADFFWNYLLEGLSWLIGKLVG
jgi:preprotein translocase SecE subunit